MMRRTRAADVPRLARSEPRALLVAGCSTVALAGRLQLGLVPASTRQRGAELTGQVFRQFRGCHDRLAAILSED